MKMEEAKKENLEELFSDLFQQTSGTGEEELLRIASTYSRQITGYQMKLILFLEYLANVADHSAIKDFIVRWLELKQFNNSDRFVMRALEYISLRKFLGENAIKVNIDK